MAIRKTASGKWQWDLKLPRYGRQRHTFATEEAAKAHDLMTQARHVEGHAYQPPTNSDVKATKRGESIAALVEHVDRVRWSLQLSSTRDGKGWHKHPQLRNAEIFRDFVGPATPCAEALTAKRIDEFVIHVRKRGIKTITVNKYLNAIGVLLEKAVAMRYCEVHFKMPRQVKPVAEKLFQGRRAITRDEEKQILDLCVRLGRHDMADLFTVCVETAIRPGPVEIGRIPWTDIAAKRIAVDASVSKANRKTRKIPLSPRAAEALARIKAANPDSPGPFAWARDWRKVDDFWEVLRKHLPWMDAAVVPYSLRHTCCSRWANDRRIDARQAALWAGHSLATQQNYVHQIDEGDDMADVVRELYETKTPREIELEERLAKLEAQLLQQAA